MASIEIRLLERADETAAAALSSELGYPTSPADMARRLAAVLGLPDHAVFGAVDGDGSLLGWVHVCERRLLIDGPSSFVEGVVVAPEARRSGVGRALMAAAEGWAEARGVQTVRLRSAAKRADAHAFYRALGYAVGPEAVGFEKSLRPDDTPS